MHVRHLKKRTALMGEIPIFRSFRRAHRLRRRERSDCIGTDGKSARDNGRAAMLLTWNVWRIIDIAINRWKKRSIRRHCPFLDMSGRFFLIIFPCIPFCGWFFSFDERIWLTVLASDAFFFWNKRTAHQIVTIRARVFYDN